jgi:hypothetical protein
MIANMAEIIGVPGTEVEVAGIYACSECGHRLTLTQGGTFPPAHHPEKPWTLMVAE